MKKIISLILSFTIILSCFSFASVFAASTYEKPSNFAEMSELLSALNVTDEQFVSGDRSITRAEFVKMVVGISGLAEYLTETTTPSFSDVAADNPYAPYIELAKNYRIAFGYADGTFKPEGEISLTEAIVYLIRLLGYSDIADAKGGYPGGYHTVAQSIDLLSGVKIPFVNSVSADCAINLIFNALNANVLKMDEISSESYSIEEGCTLMYKSFRIVKEKGVLKGIDLTSLVGPNDVTPYHIQVNNVSIFAGNYSAHDLLGYNVNAYYKETEDKNILVYICENIAKNKTQIVNISDITSISDYTVFETDENGKTKNHKYNRGASILFNGVSTKAAFNLTIFNKRDGSKLQGNVALIDNSGDGVYDVISVNAYEEFIVGKIDKAANIAYDENNASNNILLDTTIDDPYTIIYNELNEEIQLSKVKTGSSIVIYKSKDDANQKFIKAYVSENKVEGTLNAVTNEDGVYYCTIGVNDYPMSDYAVKYYKNSIGSHVSAVINYHGEVAYIIEKGNTSEKWGLLRSVKVTTNPDVNYTFQILDENGEFVEYGVAKYITVDGLDEKIRSDRDSDMEDILFSRLINASKEISAIGREYLSGNDLKDLCQMIKYRVDSNNNINYIDTIMGKNGYPTTRINAGENDSVFYEKFSGETAYTLGGIVIGAKYYGTNATKVFLYHSTDKEEFGVTSATTVYTNLAKVNGYAFYSSSNTVYPDIFMKENDRSTSYNSNYTNNYAIIHKITETVDKNENKALKVYTYVNGAAFTYVVSPSLTPTTVPSGFGSFVASNLKEGDVINFAIDPVTGEFSAYDLIYRNGTVYTPSTSNQPVNLAYVYDVQNDGFLYAVTSDITKVEDEIKSGNYRTAKADVAAILIYDSSKPLSQRIRQGTYADLYSYKEFKDEPEKVTKVLIHAYSTAYYRPIDIFVIK